MNNLIIISGPSGSGKSTLIRKLLAANPELRFSVSHTTRLPRKKEICGHDYHFISQAKFKKMIQDHKFAEWAEVHGHYYGTSWQEIRKQSVKGLALVLDIDVQGARNIKCQFPEAMAVFVIPPSLAELKKRLRKRELKWNNETKQRLQTALGELHEYGWYEYLIVNRDLEKAFFELHCLYVAFCRQMVRNKDKINQLVRGRK